MAVARRCIDLRHCHITESVFVAALAVVAPVAESASEVHHGLDLGVTLLADGAVFIDRVRAKGIVFWGRCSFVDSIFSQGADFGSARFKNNVNFTRTRFDGKTTFSNSQFCEQFFQRAMATPAVQFDGATFADDVSFADATFATSASFANGRFVGRSDFSGTRFECDWLAVSFRRARFDGDVTFRRAHWAEADVTLAQPDFSEVAFISLADMTWTTLPRPSFAGCELGRTMDLGHMRSRGRFLVLPGVKLRGDLWIRGSDGPMLLCLSSGDFSSC